MGNTPIEEEIPVDFEDLYIDVQQALDIYYKLRDEWDHMSGEYLGKNYVGLIDILDILEIPKEDRRTMFELLNTIDYHRSETIRKSKPKKA